jgi:phosphatidylglycerol:prolipoprotein diacylglycerol transferase
VHPVILKLGPLTFHSYGVMIAISFAIGTVLAVRRAEARGIPGEKITDLALVVLVSSLIGARILYVIPHWPEFAGEPLGVVRIWEGGLTLYGGVILAVLASYAFVRRQRLPWARVADSVAVPLALGLGIARIGCFLNGCCHGRPTSGPFGIVFPAGSVAGDAFSGAAVLPTQLLESAFGFVLLGAIHLIERSKPRDGVSILVVLVGYAAFRFLLDFARFYEEAMVVTVGGLALSVNQIVSLVGVVGGVLAYLKIRGGRRGVGDAGEAGAGSEGAGASGVSGAGAGAAPRSSADTSVGAPGRRP